MEIGILVFLIILNGMFAMSEIALVTAKRSRLQRLADDGSKSARRAMDLGDDPTQFLSTIQIGITAIGVLNGIVGEALIASAVAEYLQTLGLSESLSRWSATAVVVVSITYVSIVIGELVPKRFAQFHAEGTAQFVARPIALLAKLSFPFVYLLSKSTNLILRLLGIDNSKVLDLTEEDIHAVLKEGSQSGVIEKQEHDIVRNVFRLDDRQLSSLMTPRSEIVYWDLTLPNDTNLDVVMGSEHSRFPVCRGSLHNVLGVITAKRLLKLNLMGGDDLATVLKPAIFVPETLTGMKLLEQFRESGVQMVFVVDEYGEVIGMVTLQDVLEALAGEFRTQDIHDVWAVQRADESWLLDGLIPIDELKDRLEIKSFPDSEKVRYNTLSGMIMWLVGGVPRTGDIAVWQGWRFEVVDLDGRRIDKVLASRVYDE